MQIHSRELEFTLVSAPSPHSIHRSQNNWHQPTNAMTMRRQLENFAALIQRELLASLG